MRKTGLDLHMVAPSSIASYWLQYHLYIHVSLHVHHRQLRGICSVGFDPRRPGQVPGCWWNDRSRHSYVQELGDALDFDVAGMYQCACATNPVPSLSVRTEPQEAQ
jgi:hypothetical protein